MATPAHVIKIVGQCEKGVYFNWSQYLVEQFLDNVLKAQERGKVFYYSWLILLIVLVSWELPKDAVFPPLENDMCEGAWFSNLWDSKEPKHIEENKTFWLLYEGSISTTINSQSCLSLIVYDKYMHIAAF